MFHRKKQPAQPSAATRSRRICLPVSVQTAVLGCSVLLAVGLAGTSLAAVDFSRDIQPIFSENCYACHGPDKDKRKGGLRLDTKEGAFNKLDSGDQAIVPGQPAQSRLLQVVSLPPDHDDHMPPKKSGKKLTQGQLHLLRRWVEQGAKWAAHWAYVPPQRPSPPSVKKRAWPRNDIDRFILARLEKQGLPPNPEADRYTLARRAALDLTGLPPTVQEVDAFLADKNPEAYEKLVDRLLASPHFGERMALAWLDQARYADTSGYHFDGVRQMHLWRDWVIEAFNQNKPFDQFTIEQLAGDLLPKATLEQKIATGFHRNVMTTDEGGIDPEEYLAKYQVDRVSTTAQVWLGSTLGCAECHDHKYDPFTTKEFYQFYAFFNRIPEMGLDGTRTRNPGPVLRVPSSEQGSRLLNYLDTIPRAEKALGEREADLPKAQEKWEKEIHDQPLKPPEIPGLAAEFALDDSLPPNAEFAGTNGPVFAPGKLGQALRLGGATNDFVDAGQAVRFEYTNSFSYGVWIKFQAPGGAVLSKMDEGPSYRGFDLLITDGKVEVHLVNKFPENALKAASKDPLSTNRWQHLFVTYDGSHKAAGLKLFVDGKPRPLDTPNDSLSATITNAAPLLIGARQNAFPFHGLIDDVRFFHRALKPEEVVDLVAYPNLLIVQTAADQRGEEQKEDLKRFFREHRATEFLAAQNHLAKLRKEKEDLMAEIPDSMVMEEMEKPRDTFLLIRGNYQKKGEKVEPGTPACWPPLATDKRADRLALARWIASTNNPLTARVTVNRYWAMLFGTGLVKTSNDFGSQGERPSHPELLDWLACEFMNPVEPSSGAGFQPASSGRLAREGAKQADAVRGRDARKSRLEARPTTAPTSAPWSIKHILRLLVTSAAYRQSAVVTKEKLERDPYNRLVSRGPRLRLDAEFIRDNALAISGLLNPKIGGPSIKPYQPPGIWDVTDHKYEPSKGADLYRRGLYVFWKRAAHYPSFQTFDAPSRETCTLLRPRTSTPLQSLVVMNDPVYVEAARALAARVLSEGGSTLLQQLTYAFRLALARPPQKKELEILEKTYRQQHDNFALNQSAAEDLLKVGESANPKHFDAVELAAMTGVANVLLNLNETLSK